MRGSFVATCLLLAAAVALAGCGDDDAPPATSPTSAPTSVAATTALRLGSPAFADGAPIPAAFTCDGAGGSPPLTWEGVPAAARSLILLVEDRDAPGGGFDHWVVYAIPADLAGLPAAASPRPGGLALAAFEGLNGAGKVGYFPPCPPTGEQHRYRFSLLTLDAALPLPAGRSKAAVLDVAAGHTLATTTLTGTYHRP